MRENDKMMKVVDFTVEEDDFAEEVSSDETEKKTGKAAYVARYDRLYFGSVLEECFLPNKEQKSRNIELVAKVQSVDSGLEEVKEALSALIVENRRLVYGVVRTWQDRCPSGTGVDDLLSAAFDAFIEAAKNNDPAKSSFATYARQQVEFAMKDNCWAPYEESKDIKICSLEETIGVDDKTEREDFLPDEHWADGFEQVERREQVRVMLGELNDFERQVVERRFNLRDEYDKPWSLEQLGKKYGYTRQGIDCILQRAFKKMRRAA